MTNVIPFDFEGAAVRIVMREGEPWFVAADVCGVLEHGNPRQVVSRLDDDEKGVLNVDTLGGRQEVTAINESGLYSLIMTSRKEAARRFKKWVTAEVLPSIRKSGGYMVAQADETPEELALRAMRVMQDTVDRQRLALAEALPKASALDRIARADGSLCITDAAKALQVRPKDLFAYLQQNGWIYRRPGGASFLGYQTKTTAGLLEHKVTTILRPDGSERIAEQVLVTAQGLAKLAALLNPQELVA